MIFSCENFLNEIFIIAQDSPASADSTVQRFLERISARENSQFGSAHAADPFDQFTSSSNVVALRKNSFSTSAMPPSSVSSASSNHAVSNSIAQATGLTATVSPAPVTPVVAPVSLPALSPKSVTPVAEQLTQEDKIAAEIIGVSIHNTPVNVGTDSSINDSTSTDASVPRTPPRDNSRRAVESLENTPTSSDIDRPMDTSE